ncbi:hypothetical protein DWQ65_04365 [Treponema phagedenis]|uniref:Tetratricopeptide repeat protein n=1 Tax=Treponema phagedenis TaxID=162 RepID=A0A0B7GSY5_TREPH|nr:hypothetical protein [Treponema phagedenis]EFW36412.1 hypothetical protein HMPREF9554_03110 [Treponema phagedenis F0421]NVP22942.1 hypothetical protein [Treponema phagedenis]QEJ95063.1 hypothetical protein FUT79_07530 [Treponema phagedenis]QEJ98263.1 hypothetical protein FUT82_09810 [Treponema phagedenis]QEK00988.1 hypothetical protein FUT84_07375 [Treponema phagedenis]
MNNEIKIFFNKNDNYFIKTSEQPIKTLSSQQKALLNRQGNKLFNEGKLKEAERIYLTTGYSDGLSRIGDTYLKANQKLTALKFYYLAGNFSKAEPLIDDITKLIKLLVKD